MYNVWGPHSAKELKAVVFHVGATILDETIMRLFDYKKVVFYSVLLFINNAIYYNI